MLLQKLIYDVVFPNPDVSFRNGYSGRGMYGANCIGIIGRDADCQRVIADVVKQLRNQTMKVQLGSSELENTQVFEQGVDMLLGAAVDRLGYDTIYYWPGLEPIPSNNPVWDAYRDGECPDCGAGIPMNVEAGHSCWNCGHVFCAEKGDD